MFLSSSGHGRRPVTGDLLLVLRNPIWLPAGSVGRALEKSANDVSLIVSAAGSDAGARGIARLTAAELIRPIFLREFDMAATETPVEV